jgi:hypothetical protein
MNWWAEIKPLWLTWLGIEMPALFDFWRLYLRRFAIDHWYRFAKQRLHWTLPKLSTPEQCERWSDLLPLLTWQLWLARDIVTDNPLPWQKQQPVKSRTGGSGNGRSFSDWHPGCCGQTAWKVSRMAYRERPHA